MGYYLKLVTAPVAEPWTLAEVKKDRGIHDEDKEFDLALGLLVKAARRWAEHFTSRCLIEQTWDLLFPEGFPWLAGRHYVLDPYEIRIPRAPLKVSTGITHIKYLDTNGTQQVLVAGTDYNVMDRGEPAIIVPAYGTSWPSTRDWTNSSGQYPVEVRFIAGYGMQGSAVPENIRKAMLLLIGHWHENREEVTDLSLATIPAGAEALLWMDRFFPR